MIRRVAIFVLLCAPLPCFAQTCDQTPWQHVYHPKRLKVVQRCVQVVGTIVDATHGVRRDGVRHEKDGDPHGWLKLDAAFENLLIAGNRSTQGGNLVYEIVCLFPVTQEDAKAACHNYKSPIKLAPVGCEVRITGSLVEDLDHQPIHREIHPVSSIEVLSCGSSKK